MSLPDNTLPFKTATIDNFGRLWIGKNYAGHQIIVRFTDTKKKKSVVVLDSGRANVGRPFKGRECDVYILRK